MSSIRIYIVEDEVLFMNKMEMLVDQLGYDLIGSTDNSDTALAEIPKMQPDLLLVDIGINGTMDGIELINSLKPLTVPVIFVTAYKDKETFNRSKILQPFAYMTKPFDNDDLQRSIELALESASTSTSKESAEPAEIIDLPSSFFVRTGRKLEKIEIKNIECLEVDGNYTSIHQVGEDKHVVKLSLDQLMTKLPSAEFIRIHRGYIVNLSAITSIDPTDMLVYIDKSHYPIGRAYKEDLLSRFKFL